MSKRIDNQHKHVKREREEKKSRRELNMSYHLTLITISR